MNHKVVYRTTPATPGLVYVYIKNKQSLLSQDKDAHFSLFWAMQGANINVLNSAGKRLARMLLLQMGFFLYFQQHTYQNTDASFVLTTLLVTTLRVTRHPTYLYCTEHYTIQCTIHSKLYCTVHCIVHCTVPYTVQLTVSRHGWLREATSVKKISFSLENVQKTTHPPVFLESFKTIFQTC